MILNVRLIIGHLNIERIKADLFYGLAFLNYLDEEEKGTAFEHLFAIFMNCEIFYIPVAQIFHKLDDFSTLLTSPVKYNILTQP